MESGREGMVECRELRGVRYKVVGYYRVGIGLGASCIGHRAEGINSILGLGCRILDWMRLVQRAWSRRHVRKVGFNQAGGLRSLV